MRALYSGVSGLRIHQTKTDVIGNNIANVNTVGFKSSSITFTDILYQTTQSASGPNSETGTVGKNAMQIGLGASVGAISSNMKSGSSQRTDNALDLMINGDAFFVVSDGNENFFTKAGSFKTDANGTLCTATGLAVMGWQPNEKGDGVITDKVSKLNVLSAENLYTAPSATKNAYFTGNIDPTDKELEKGKEIMYAFYDNKGNKYNAVFTLKKSTAAGATSDQYTLTMKDVLDSEGKSFTEKGFSVKLNDKVVENTGSTGGTGGTGGGGTTTGKIEGEITLSFSGENGSFLGVGATNTKTDKTKVTLSLTGNPSPFDADGITIDFSELTEFSAKGASTVTAFAGTSSKNNVGAGKPVGNMKGVQIDQAGKIYGSYDNGDTKLLGQIAAASFANPAGLEAVGNSLYRATLNSGDFNGIGSDITALGGSYTSGVLEMSNVDLATEFTELIIAQRGYQSNSRIITTSDTLLEELINLKR